jgi:hypothetical protein
LTRCTNSFRVVLAIDEAYHSELAAVALAGIFLSLGAFSDASLFVSFASRSLIRLHAVLNFSRTRVAGTFLQFSSSSPSTHVVFQAAFHMVFHGA